MLFFKSSMRWISHIIYHIAVIGVVSTAIHAFENTTVFQDGMVLTKEWLNEVNEMLSLASPFNGGDTLVKRDSEGRFQTVSPISGDDVPNKAYVDSLISTSG